MPRVASSGDLLETPLHAMDGDLLGLQQKLWLEQSRTELQQLLPLFPVQNMPGIFLQPLPQGQKPVPTLQASPPGRWEGPTCSPFLLRVLAVGCNNSACKKQQEAQDQPEYEG